MVLESKKLSNLQLELLKVFSYELSEEQLSEIRNLLANYFAKKASDQMDLLWEQNNWSEETMNEWGKEHMRVRQNG